MENKPIDSEELLQLPIRRDVIFDVNGTDHSGYVEITRVIRDGDDIKCDLVAVLRKRGEGSVLGVDVMQAFTLAVQKLEAHMKLVDAEIV